MNFESFKKSCEENPIMCLVGIILLLTVVQNCVMDIGLGPWLGMDSFADFTGAATGISGTDPVASGMSGEAGAPVDTAAPAPAEELGQNEGQLAVPELSRTPSTCYPQQSLKPEDLLPAQESKAIQEFNTAQPVGEGIIQGVNLLDAGAHIGVNTVGQSLRNANQQLRSEPPNPQVNVSPWMNTTIGPDLIRRPLEIDESCPTGQQ